MSRIIRFFPESDLRCGHLGLAAQAKRIAGLDMRRISEGEFVMFANKSLTGVKILTTNNILCYLKSPDHRPLSMKALQYLPASFNGRSFNYTAALKKALLADGMKE